MGGVGGAMRAPPERAHTHKHVRPCMPCAATGKAARPGFSACAVVCPHIVRHPAGHVCVCVHRVRTVCAKHARRVRECFLRTCDVLEAQTPSGQNPPPLLAASTGLMAPKRARPELPPVPSPAIAPAAPPVRTTLQAVRSLPVYYGPPLQHEDAAVDRLMDFLDVFDPPWSMVQLMMGLLEDNVITMQAIRAWWPLLAVHVLAAQRAKLEDEVTLGRPHDLPATTNWLSTLPPTDSRTQVYSCPSTTGDVRYRRHVADSQNEHYWNRTQMCDTAEVARSQGKRRRVHMVTDADLADISGEASRQQVWWVTGRAGITALTSD